MKNKTVTKFFTRVVCMPCLRSGHILKNGAPGCACVYIPMVPARKFTEAVR